MIVLRPRLASPTGVWLATIRQYTRQEGMMHAQNIPCGGGREPQPAPHDVLHYAGLTIHIPERWATLHGRPLALTPTEFRLLTTLASAPGHLFTYCDLAERVLGYACAEREARANIQVHINNLRRKLAEDAHDTRFIHCVRGVGYRWNGHL